MNIKYYVLIFFMMCTISGCSKIQQRTLIVRNYIPANQVNVSNFNELKRSADGGDAIAQYEIGKLYMTGLGVHKNHHTAMKYFENSANQGYGQAQYYLGLMYFDGKGVLTDFVKGCEWMKLAKDNGITEAFNFYSAYCY